jgi:retron-type reverse transcriptase
LTEPRYGRVNFNGSKSQKYIFERGVPLGSPLSPLLFNIYVSKVGVSGNKNISQFADDLMILETHVDIKIAVEN